MSGFFERSKELIKKWLARLGFAVVFGGLLLSALPHPVNLPVNVDVKFMLAVALVLLAGAYEVVFETKKQAEKTQKAVEDFAQTVSPKLYSLEKCQDDLERILEETPRTETVVIKHIGLNMTDAWKYVRKLLFHRDSKRVNVEYELLILTDDKAKTSAWPAEVAEWSEGVPKELQRIKTHMEEAEALFREERRRLKFSVKKYEELPVVHGWRLQQPKRVWHVALCRWDKKEYTWGSLNYFKVDEQSQDRVTLEIARLFDSYFEHLWLVSSPVEGLQLDYDPSKKAPAADGAGQATTV